MIIYNPAFDLYHAIYRIAHILRHIGDGERFEVDRLRIWDFYLLYPHRLHQVSLRQLDKEVAEARKAYIDNSKSPYEYSGDCRKLFEWMKPFQLSALNCLVSCGILSREAYLGGRVSVADRQALDAYVEKAGGISERQQNALSFLALLSRHIPLTGPHGLKARTQLLESRYDAE